MSNQTQASSEEIILWRKRIPLKRGTIEKMEAEAASTVRTPEQMAAYIIEAHYRAGGKAGSDE